MRMLEWIRAKIRWVLDKKLNTLHDSNVWFDKLHHIWISLKWTLLKSFNLDETFNFILISHDYVETYDWRKRVNQGGG